MVAMSSIGLQLLLGQTQIPAYHRQPVNSSFLAHACPLEGKICGSMQGSLPDGPLGNMVASNPTLQMQSACPPASERCRSCQYQESIHWIVLERVYGPYPTGLIQDALWMAMYITYSQRTHGRRLIQPSYTQPLHPCNVLQLCRPKGVAVGHEKDSLPDVLPKRALANDPVLHMLQRASPHGVECFHNYPYQKHPWVSCRLQAEEPAVGFPPNYLCCQSTSTLWLLAEVRLHWIACRRPWLAKHLVSNVLKTP